MGTIHHYIYILDVTIIDHQKQPFWDITTPQHYSASTPGVMG
jgi:hypothetical protein